MSKQYRQTILLSAFSARDFILELEKLIKQGVKISDTAIFLTSFNNKLRMYIDIENKEDRPIKESPFITLGGIIDLKEKSIVEGSVKKSELERMSLQELREVCKEVGVTGRHKPTMIKEYLSIQEQQ